MNQISPSLIFLILIIMQPILDLIHFEVNHYQIIHFQIYLSQPLLNYMYQ